MNKKQAKNKLDKILRENPDPNKWSVLIKLLIAFLTALLGALGECKFNLLSDSLNYLNIF